MIIYSFDCGYESMGLCIMKIEKPLSHNLPDIQAAHQLITAQSQHIGKFYSTQPQDRAKLLVAALDNITYPTPDIILIERQAAIINNKTNTTTTEFSHFLTMYYQLKYPTVPQYQISAAAKYSIGILQKCRRDLGGNKYSANKKFSKILANCICGAMKMPKIVASGSDAHDAFLQVFAFIRIYGYVSI